MSELNEARIREELHNIVYNYPVLAGEIISLGTANVCLERRLAERNAKGDYIPTSAGIRLIAGNKKELEL